MDLRTGTTTSAVHAGISAYANKQRLVFHNLAVCFSQRWRSALIFLSLPHTWATTFLKVHKELLDNLDLKKCKQTEDPPIFHTHVASPPPIVTSADILPLTKMPDKRNQHPLGKQPITTYGSVIRQHGIVYRAK